jgi:hypothetical protein
MQDFVIKGKAKTVFRMIRLMAMAEKMEKEEEKKIKEAQRKAPLN